MRFDQMLFKAWVFQLALLWIFFGLGLLVAWILIHAAMIDPGRLFAFSTAGIHYVARPLMSRGEAWGLNPALILAILNLTATAALASPITLVPLFDPRRMHVFPSWLRRILIHDPTLGVFRPFPGFRSIPDPELRPLYAWLYFLPLFPIGLLGVIIGLTAASAAAAFRSVPLAAGYLLPHGLLEIPAILLGGALPVGAFFAAQGALRQGRTDRVFCILEERRRFASIRTVLIAILLLLATAAIVEAYFTESFAFWFEARWK